MRTTTRLVAALLSVLVVASGCGGSGVKKAISITVASAAFAENELVAEIYAQALEAKGVKVTRKFNLGPREMYIPALLSKEADLVPEYTGNLLAYFDSEGQSVARSVRALRRALPEELKVLDPSEAQNQDSLNVTSATAERYGLESIGELERVPGLRMGANAEFAARPYGLVGLGKYYGLSDFAFVPINDGGGEETVHALRTGRVTVADIYSSSASIRENDFVTLRDPEGIMTPQNVVPLIRSEKTTDEVVDTLNAVQEALTTEDLVEINFLNQGKDKVPAAKVAKDWLEKNKLA